MQLKVVNGSMIHYNALGLNNRCVQPQGELNVTIEVKFPLTPGKYVLSFRLVYGENNTEFGDEISVGLVAQAPAGRVKNTDDGQDGSCCDPKLKSCKTDSCQCCQEPATEVGGSTFYVDRDCACCNKSVNDLDLSINSWLEIGQDGGEEEATQG